jgi:hypothetical protein
VGFDPLEYEYDASRETGDEWQDFFNPPLNYTAQELLEVSVVTIPANPEALPVGRDLQQRFLDRALARRAPPKPAPMTVESLRELVDRIAKEEFTKAAALSARKSGDTTLRR